MAKSLAGAPFGSHARQPKTCFTSNRSVDGQIIDMALRDTAPSHVQHPATHTPRTGATATRAPPRTVPHAASGAAPQCKPVHPQWAMRAPVRRCLPPGLARTAASRFLTPTGPALGSPAAWLWHVLALGAGLAATSAYLRWISPRRMQLRGGVQVLCESFRWVL